MHFLKNFKVLFIIFFAEVDLDIILMEMMQFIIFLDLQNLSGEKVLHS